MFAPQNQKTLDTEPHVFRAVLPSKTASRRTPLTTCSRPTSHCMSGLLQMKAVWRPWFSKRKSGRCLYFLSEKCVLHANPIKWTLFSGQTNFSIASSLQTFFACNSPEALFRHDFNRSSHGTTTVHCWKKVHAVELLLYGYVLELPNFSKQKLRGRMTNGTSIWM